MRSGEAEFRPAGVRTEWLEDFELPDEAWARFGIPIGLAFFMRTGRAGARRRLLPEPGRGDRVRDRLRRLGPGPRAQPGAERLEPDAEALIVNRIAEPHQYAIAPIDECYRLVGLIKASWEGISGGAGPERAIEHSSTSCGSRA